MLFMFLPAPLIGVLTLGGLIASVLFWVPFFILPGVALKLLLPLPGWRRFWTRYAVFMAEHWAGTNRWVYRLLHDRHWQIEIDGTIDPRRSYLLVANHQSWADILVIFDAFHDRMHFPRFFLKQELIWLPLIGVVCWGLDMPFMKRHSHKAILANPRLREDDARATRRFCEKYRGEPVTVVNFVEGTRFTEAKRIAKSSPYRRLLAPKSGGLRMTLSAMGDQFEGLIDIAIAYRRPAAGHALAWSWLCGEQSSLVLHAEVRPIPADILRSIADPSDAGDRARFQSWLNGLWSRKDALLERLQAQAEDGIHPAPSSRQA